MGTSKVLRVATARRLALSVAALLTVLGTGGAWAHVRPTGCTGTGLSFGVTVFRADGVTQIQSGVGSVSPCETIVYVATVGARAASFNDCDFEGGSIQIQTPDGVLHDVTPVGGVPLIGLDAGANPSVASQPVSYTVRQQDIVSGQITAPAFYGCALGPGNPPGCQPPTLHNNTTDTSGVPTGSTSSVISVTPCPASTQCVSSVCDPNLQGTGPDAGRKGLCTTSNVTDSTPCSADNAGNPVTAIPGSCKTPGCEAGQCVRAHINVTDSTA